MPRRRRPRASDLAESVEREVGQLAHLTSQLGDVLETELERLAESDDNELPSADWVRSYRAYEQSVSALMQERRKNAALIAGAQQAGEQEPPLSDAEYQVTLDALVERRIAGLSEQELGRLMLDKLNQETKT